MRRTSKKATEEQVVQNAVKTLLANIRFASVDEPVKTVVITSSIPHEGKSTVAYNLAQAMASSGKRTLIVECDMRRRMLAERIGAHARYGVYAVLAGQISLEGAAVSTPYTNLWFLDSEPNIPNPADILSSQRFRQFMKTLHDSYDYVVIDTPPVGAFIDAAVVAAMADATLFVVRERFAHRNEIVEAYAQLKKADANVIGAVMNMCKVEANEYYYAYYNEDGKRVRKHKSEKSSFMPARRSATSFDATASADKDVSSAHVAKSASSIDPSSTAQFLAAAQTVQPVQPVTRHRDIDPYANSRRHPS